LTETSIKNELQQLFITIPSIHSVYATGSFLKNSFQSDKSDIDLSLILSKSNFKDIHKLERGLKNIGDDFKIKISTCYSHIHELEKDMKQFNMHIHGKKRTSYLYDFCFSNKIYGEGIEPFLKNIYYHPFEVFSNISELITNIYHNLGQTKKEQTTCLNISIVVAKITNTLNNIYEPDKQCTIEQFRENIDVKRGNELLELYLNNKTGKLFSDKDFQFMIDFCYYCQDHSRTKVEVTKNEIKKIK